MGDDQADTEMAASPDAPTEFRNPAPVETQHAWSVEDETGDDVPYPSDGRASWRRVAIIGSAIMVAAATVVVGVFLFGHPDKQLPQASPTQVASPPPPPPAVPPWYLNGTYKYDINNPAGIMRNVYGATVGDMSGFGVPAATNWIAYKTECLPSGCKARYVQLDDGTQRVPFIDETGKPITGTLKWTGAAWVSDNTGPHGGLQVDVGCEGSSQPDLWEVWTVLSPQPDGAFRGTSFRDDMQDSCGIPLDRHEVPVFVMRTGNAPPGVL